MSRISNDTWRYLFDRAPFVHVNRSWYPSLTEGPLEPLTLFRYTTPERVRHTPWSTLAGAQKYGGLRRTALTLGAHPGVSEIPNLRMYRARSSLNGCGPGSMTDRTHLMSGQLTRTAWTSSRSLRTPGRLLENRCRVLPEAA